MEVRLLGALDVRHDGREVRVDARRERAVLETLALRPATTVPAEVLVDAVWGEDPPASAVATLHSHVSRLRRVLPAGVVETDGRGYRLAVRPDEVDAVRLEDLLQRARVATASDAPRMAAPLLDEACALWRGQPLTDLADGPFRRAEQARLEELGTTALEDRAETLLTLGGHESLVADLEGLVVRYPYRERLWRLLLLALHRSDRRSEALDAYDRLRTLLRVELGISPSAATRALAEQIAREDPALDAAPPAPPSTLPVPLTSFVGRSALLAHVGSMVLAHRLVTLVGPGGVGKTRLALAVAADQSRARTQWPDGVFFVEAMPHDDASAVIAALDRQLEPPGRPSAADAGSLRSVTEALAGSTALVVLDGAERLAGTLGHLVNELLNGAPAVHVLVTSRVALAVAGERRVEVPAMELPPELTEELEDNEAIRLFVDRWAPGHRPTDARELAAVARLCRVVDGLPLGIELLAARARALTPAVLAAELARRPDLALRPARPGDDDQHGSLEAVLRSTTELLTADQRSVLGRLAVFRGDFDLAAARDVGGVEDLRDLERLLAMGLVATDAEAVVPRYRLTDTTRAFAARLAEPEAWEAARCAHARHYRRLAQRAGRELGGLFHSSWSRRIQQEGPDIRAALRWYLDHEPEGALGFVRATSRDALVWGDHLAARTLYTRLLEVAADDGTADPLDVAWVLSSVAWPRFLTGDVAGGMAAAESAATAFLEAGEPLGAGEALASRAHMELLGTGDVGASTQWYQRAVEQVRRVDSPEVRGLVLVEAAQAMVLGDRHDDELTAAVREAEGALTEARDHQRLAHLRMVQAIDAYALDDLDATERFADETIRESRIAGTQMFAQVAILATGVVRLHTGDLPGARERILRALRMADDRHNLLQTGIALQALAVHHALTGSPSAAARLWGAARTVSPSWPLFERRYGELLAPARDELGESWQVEVDRGAGEPLDQVVASVLGRAAATGDRAPAGSRSATSSDR